MQLLGFQICDENGDNIQGDDHDPSGLCSFEVMTPALAAYKMADLPNYRLQPIYDSDIEEPHLVGPDLPAVLIEALQAWGEQFDGEPDSDLDVSGADLVDWFAQWRLRAREALKAAGVKA